MNKAVPWRIKGVGFDARTAAIEAARRSGMSLGEWLNTVIAEQAADDGVDVLQVVDVGASYPHRVTYHPTCHSLRMLRVGERPLRLLRAVRGIDLVELPEVETCCGFGGTFSLKNADTSAAMLADKVEAVRATGAQVVSAGDASCLMHIGGGLSRAGAGARAVHLAQILASQE